MKTLLPSKQTAGGFLHRALGIDIPPRGWYTDLTTGKPGFQEGL